MPSRQLAVYPINDGPDGKPVDSTPAFETALGAPVALKMAFPDHEHGVANVLPSIDEHVKVEGPGPKIWTMGNCLDLADVVKGGEDASFKESATHILAVSPAAGKIIIRPPHEANGMHPNDAGVWVPNYPRWFAPGREPMFIDAWKRKVDIFRSVSDRFLFDWCVNHTMFIDGAYYDPRKFYPGAPYLDFIGGDLYLAPGDFGTIASIIGWKKTGGGVGFDMIAAFAKSEGKRMSLAEWAVSRDSPEFIDYVGDVIESGDVAVQSYLHTSIYQLSAFPKAQAAYRRRFGQPSFLGLGINYTATAGQALTVPLRASQGSCKFGVTGTGCSIQGGSNLVVGPMAAGAVVSATVRAINAYGTVGSQKVTFRAA